MRIHIYTDPGIRGNMDIGRLTASAEGGDVTALAELGRHYRDSDIVLAVGYLERASDLGDVGSASSLGYIYLTGEGVEPDPERARLHLTRAAEAGDATAMCNMGFLCSSDPGESVGWFRRAAEAGSVRGMKNLATAYATGQEGIPMDKAMAAELYSRAADLGDPDAQYDLAFMLDSGEGIPMDRGRAETLFRAAADQGDTDACLCMGGILFERGEYADAEGYFLSAAMRDDVKAEYNLGLLYMGDYLGEPDTDKAREWFDSAAEKGFAYAQTMVGTMELDAGNVGGAESMFRAAAEQGEPMAQYNLGALGLSNQIGMGFGESVEWLTKAAQQGVEPAYRILMQLNSHNGN